MEAAVVVTIVRQDTSVHAALTCPPSSFINIKIRVCSSLFNR
jgi:hypothetical protein